MRKSESRGKTLDARQVDTDANIQSLVGDVSDSLLTVVTRLVSRLLPSAETKKKVFILDAAHAHNMNAKGRADGPVERTQFTDTYGGKHVAQPTERLFVPTNPGAHFTLNVVDNVANTICTLEPLNYDREATNKPFRQRLEQYLAHERARLGLPKRPAPYKVVPKPASLPHQTDGTSCGPFCFAYIYFIYVHGRLPTRADFSGRDQLVLRLVMLDASLTGCVKRGLLPGAATAQAGRAAGAEPARDPRAAAHTADAGAGAWTHGGVEPSRWTAADTARGMAADEAFYDAMRAVTRPDTGVTLEGFDQDAEPYVFDSDVEEANAYCPERPCQWNRLLAIALRREAEAAAAPGTDTLAAAATARAEFELDDLKVRIFGAWRTDPARVNRINSNAVRITACW